MGAAGFQQDPLTGRKEGGKVLGKTGMAIKQSLGFLMEFPAELVKAGLNTGLILVIPPHIFFTSLCHFLIIIILGKEIYDRS